MGWLLHREVLAYSIKDEIREEDLMEYSMESKQLLEERMVVGEKKKKKKKKRNSGGAEEGHLKGDVSQVITALLVTAGEC